MDKDTRSKEIKSCITFVEETYATLCNSQHSALCRYPQCNPEERGQLHPEGKENKGKGKGGFIVCIHDSCSPNFKGKCKGVRFMACI